MPMSKAVELLNLLVEIGLIDAVQIELILEEAKDEKKSIDEILLKNQIVGSEKLTEVKAKLYALPYVDLTEREVDEGILNTISSEVAENYQIVCFDKLAGKIKVGVTQPDNFKAI